ncbi:substrate-binding domain-containing protein [Treponema socranskii]|uniref:substrate-binding domain-containing protein n=1 Tax=Treponema socranskii TaxID=53419 RepID=UPI0015D70D6A|nr:substrate-binding domain-containing protein [Treponema socranskii]UTD03028.1 substrate-binding domain-containing protein [Treponema socranskii subsp. buccale]
MKKLLSIMLAALLVGSLAFATGANEGGNGSKKNVVVVFIPKISGNAFFEVANEGAQKLAKQVGFTVKYDGSPDAAVANQVNIINNAIQQGADAISISTVDAAGVDQALKAARKAGLAVMTWDSDSNPDARSLMTSQGTPDILGKMLVDMGVASLKERGKNPDSDAIKYCWHYSQATVTDQNSWHVAGEKYIRQKYPKWVNVAPANYYSNQDAERAITVGEAVLSAHKDIDLIICNDSTALPGQCQAAQNLGLNQKNVTITGFATPNAIKDYCRAGILTRWGLWDCGIQGAISCYLAYWAATGHSMKVGDTIDIPTIGTVKVEPNTVLDPKAYTASDSGVVLLPERAVFTKENMDKYNF